MGRVNVIILDPTCNKQPRFSLPDDHTVGSFMPKVIETMKLPPLGPDNVPVNYKLYHKATGKSVNSNQTLSSAGVKDGDVLKLVPEPTAGALVLCFINPFHIYKR